MKKPSCLKLVILLLTISCLSCQKESDVLLFPIENFTIESKTVFTSTDSINVTYQAYLHIPYVANPIDTNYQSLNIFVPTKINGREIDASNAPILFANAVGGYMPVKNSERNTIGNSEGNSREDLALAAGIIVVDPGCRGRVNITDDGKYYGKAPAGIVDLKAAIKYLRHNKEIIPGDVEKIVSVGCSAGGAMSALLGASGNSPLYNSYFEKIGAAPEKDNFFAAACFSPIMDLEHADMAYEWEFGKTARKGKVVNQELSEQLRSLFNEYESSLNIEGKDGFGMLTADNLDEYLAKYYLNPSATKYIKSLSDKQRQNYLSDKQWMNWDGEKTSFSLLDYTTYFVGRYKGLPAFDNFELKTPENGLFGDSLTDAKHFTNFSLRHATENPNAEIDDEVKNLANLMNPMYFVLNNNEGCASHWWIRHGTTESGISRAAMVNLSTALENRGKDVNSKLFWEAMHCVDTDPEGFIAWIKEICNY